MILPSHDQQHFALKGPTGTLELFVEPPVTLDKKRVAIVCHPHPLHGGTMHNKVVTMLARTCQMLGAVVIRFNFRGVGASEGVYDNGVGEQDDLKTVIDWAKIQYPFAELWLGGFSFGSYIATKVASETPVQQLIAIAPPVNHFDFSSVLAITCPWLIVQGEEDEIVPAQEVWDWAKNRPEHPQVISMPGVIHFFHGKLIELRENILSALSKTANEQS